MNRLQCKERKVHDSSSYMCYSSSPSNSMVATEEVYDCPRLIPSVTLLGFWVANDSCVQNEGHLRMGERFQRGDNNTNQNNEEMGGLPLSCPINIISWMNLSRLLHVAKGALISLRSVLNVAKRLGHSIKLLTLWHICAMHFLLKVNTKLLMFI